MGAGAAAAPAGARHDAARVPARARRRLPRGGGLRPPRVRALCLGLGSAAAGRAGDLGRLPAHGRRQRRRRRRAAGLARAGAARAAGAGRRRLGAGRGAPRHGERQRGARAHCAVCRGAAAAAGAVRRRRLLCGPRPHHAARARAGRPPAPLRVRRRRLHDGRGRPAPGRAALPQPAARLHHLWLLRRLCHAEPARLRVHQLPRRSRLQHNDCAADRSCTLTGQ
mmetsp:Transcript_893/g.3292  ORF Transcript_893/g.3292 Transcript_893/m.3292 type:complete len:224 (-) Transcript_893:25-696(-)